MAKRGRPPVERAMVKCAVCEKEIARYSFQIEKSRSGRFFCSKACQDVLGSKPRRKANKVCEQCGVTFYPINSGGPGRFCSIPCHDGWQARNRIHLECEVCGAAFSLSRSTVAHNGGRFCSPRCMGIAFRARPLDREHNGKPALLTIDGYIKVWEPGHPNAISSGWILEHRLVASRVLGRSLTSDEHVHHKNRNKMDNREENLEIMSGSEHGSLTGYERAERERKERDRITKELEELAEYRRRFGALT